MYFPHGLIPHGIGKKQAKPKQTPQTHEKNMRKDTEVCIEGKNNKKYQKLRKSEKQQWKYHREYIFYHCCLINLCFLLEGNNREQQKRAALQGKVNQEQKLTAGHGTLTRT